MSKKPETDFPLLDYIDDLVEELRKHVPRALREWEADSIHDARVATRRLKAALDLMQAVLSDEYRKPFSQVLKKLRRRLGPMRDLDVMLEHLAEMRQGKAHSRAIDWLMENLRRRRDAARDESSKKGSPARVLSRLGAWWGLREEVLEAKEAGDALLAESLHLQLDAFAERADRLVAGKSADAHGHQDPHELRIAGKSLRYTLEMAAVQGHKLPGGVVGTFKRMQEGLGQWHDYVVLTEQSMQACLDGMLAHHDAELQAEVLNLARTLLKRSVQHLGSFSKLWAQRGVELSQAVRQSFPLTRSVIAPKTDPDPPGSDESPAPATPIPDAASTA